MIARKRKWCYNMAVNIEPALTRRLRRHSHAGCGGTYTPAAAAREKPAAHEMGRENRAGPGKMPMTTRIGEMSISYDKVINRRKMSGIHYHGHNELYYLISGETKYFVGDEIFRMRAGDFIFVPKGILHQTDSENCLHNERILLTFGDAVFDSQTLPLLEKLSSFKIFRIPQGEVCRAEELLRRLQGEFESNEPYRNVTIRLYILELAALLCRYRCEYAPGENASDRVVCAVSEYIRTNYAQELSLKSLSRQFALSESCLSRKFKEVSGMGISRYITSVRIHNAARMLAETECSVTQAAERCGFNDSNYFASVFKRAEGITPLRYSKSAAPGVFRSNAGGCP